MVLDAQDVVRTASDARHADVRALLAEYARVVRAAEELHGLVWVRTRPPGSAPCASWWRLPRPTLGLRILVVRHVTRSVDALSRTYARQAALGELDEQGLRTRQMIADYRAALQPIPWKSVLVLSAIAGLLVTRVLVGASADVVAYILNVNALEGEQQQALTRMVDRLLSFSTTLSPAGLVDQVTAARDVGLSGLLVLAMLMLLAAYVVLRPMSTVFRVKRMLFNLCDAPDLRRTTSTWHVPRATGIYARERVVFRDAGCAEPTETALDLALSMLGVLLVCAFFLRLWAFDPYTGRLLLSGGALPSDYGFIALTVLLAAARAAWLVRAMRSRRAGSPHGALPTVRVLPATARLVDQRSPLETFGWLVATSFVMVGWLVIPVVFYRLWSQITDAEAEGETRALAARHHPYRSFTFAGVAVAAGIATPVVVAVLTCRAVRAHAGRARVGIARIVVAVLGVVAWTIALTVWWVSDDDDTILVSSTALALAVGISGALAQKIANERVGLYGESWERGELPEHVATEFCVPPTWPAPPPGWQPTPRFRPDPSWDVVPAGWRFWHVVPVQESGGTGG